MKSYKGAIDLREKFFNHYNMIYLSNFLPNCFFSARMREVVDEYHEESEEILGLSSLVEIHKRLEKIETLKLGEFKELEERMATVENELKVPLTGNEVKIEN